MEALKNTVMDLCTKTGVSGEEKEVVETAKKYLDKYGKTKVDILGNLICNISPCKKDGIHLIIDAHIDEIGFAVIGITEEGFLKIADLSLNDKRVLTASEVYINSNGNKYYGIVTSKPPHLSSPKDYEKAIAFSDVAIDIGMDEKTAKEKISIGSKVVVKGEPKAIINDRIISKAIDNRLGCGIAIEVAKQIKDKKLNYGLTILLSTQEEVGMRGVSSAVFDIDPTHAIVIDGTFGDKEIFPDGSFELGKGPAIAVGPVLNPEMTKEIVSLAKSEKIPYQTEVTTGYTGTNADKISLVKKGVKTALISVPVKNLHSKVEMTDIKDAKLTVDLIVKYLMYLNDRK